MPPVPPVSDPDSTGSDPFGPTAGSALIVLGGGDPVDGVWLTGAGDTHAMVVAADSGLEAALAAGITVHHVVGDLDSVAAEDLAQAVAAGAEVHRHPADKDATDGELAVDLAVTLLAARGAACSSDGRRLTIVGGGGGRLDHLVGDVLLLVGDGLAPFEVTARFGPATVTVIRPGWPRTIRGLPGDLVSLLAPRGAARGVTTVGLRWPLADGDLAPGSTRGTSNQMVSDEAQVSLVEGVLVAIQPGEVGRYVEPRTSAYDPRPQLGASGFDGSRDDRPQ